MTVFGPFVAPWGAGKVAGGGLVWAGLAWGLAMYTFLPPLAGGLEWEKSVMKTIPSLVSTARDRERLHEDMELMIHNHDSDRFLVSAC